MASYIPELLMLKRILVERKTLRDAFFATSLTERVSKVRLTVAKNRVLEVLRHYQTLSFECRNLFPSYEIGKEESHLVMLALVILRKKEEETETVRASLTETFSSLRLFGDPEKVFSLLLAASKAPFVVPEEVKRSPYFYNSLLLEVPEFLLRRLSEDYGAKEAVRIAKSLHGKCLSTYGASKDRPENSILTEAKVNETTSYFRSQRPLPLNKQKELFLYPVSFFEVNALSVASIPPLSPSVLLFGLENPISILPYSFLLEDSFRPELVPVLSDGVKYRMAVDLSFEYHRKNMKAIFSEPSYVKTYLPYGHYDLVTCYALDSGIGLSRKKPELLPSLRKEELLSYNKADAERIKEAASFVKKEGFLLYLSHSLLKAEGQNIVDSFLSRHKEFTLVAEKTVFPYETEEDGGYYAILRRVKE